MPIVYIPDQCFDPDNDFYAFYQGIIDNLKSSGKDVKKDSERPISYNVNLTEAELVVISKLLGYVGGSSAVYSANHKVDEALGRNMEEADYTTVKFYTKHTCDLGGCSKMKELEEDIEIRIEE